MSKWETVRRMQVIGGVKEGGLVSKWEADGGDWRESRRRAFWWETDAGDWREGSRRAFWWETDGGERR